MEVLSHDKPVRDLRQSDFLIYDNREPKEIASVDFANRVLDIVLLIEDTAGMSPFRKRIGDIALRALSKLDRPRPRGCSRFRRHATPYHWF